MADNGCQFAVLCAFDHDKYLLFSKKRSFGKHECPDGFFFDLDSGYPLGTFLGDDRYNDMDRYFVTAAYDGAVFHPCYAGSWKNPGDYGCPPA